MFENDTTVAVTPPNMTETKAGTRQVGHDAVLAAEEGKTGMMITLDRNGDDPYQCGTSAYDIHAIANVERPVPAEWITEDGCGLNDGYIKYARPLIMGELLPIFVNGTPHHLVRK